MFTVNEYLQSWLTAAADVEPVVDGKYELFWNPEDRENDSTIGCKITAIERGRFLSFDWKGPKQFKKFMNKADPLTHVVVFFTPGEELGPNRTTEVHLIHSGWRDSKEWEEARLWFEKVWDKALEELAKLVEEL
jgi:uncharacterized protein YndB with AHSA1/START domain